MDLNLQPKNDLNCFVASRGLKFYNEEEGAEFQKIVLQESKRLN